MTTIASTSASPPLSCTQRNGHYDSRNSHHGDSEDAYSAATHLVATVAILVSALLGYGLPLAGKHTPRLRRLSFVYVLGKCLATGVVLSVALVHMLQPANAMLTHECASAWLRAHGEPLAYVLCLAAMLAMYTVELLCRGQLTGGGAHGHHTHHSHHHHGSSGVVADSSSDSGGGSSSSDDENNDAHNAVVVATRTTTGGGSGVCTARVASASEAACMQRRGGGCCSSGGVTAPVTHTTATAPASVTHVHLPAISTTSPQPSSSSLSTSPQRELCQQQQDKRAQEQQRWLSAVLLECGASAHSVFVGFAVGVSANDELASLATALVLHQFFEGIAIGASVAEAALSSSVDVCFAMLFATAAPLGACLGMGAVLYGWVNVQSAAYLAVQGTVDAACAGVLLYIGASLLLVDFAHDLQRYAQPLSASSSSTRVVAASASPPSSSTQAPLLMPSGRVRRVRRCRQQHRRRDAWRGVAMLAAVLLGAAIMSALGWYL